MRFWCIPKSTSFESPSLPPRIDRDVFLRSPPPPPRLSKQEKLARGVIVYKTRKHKNDGKSKPPIHSSLNSSLKSSASKSKPIRKVRYADLAAESPEPAASEQISNHSTSFDDVPHRGDIVHYRQQSSTSATSSSGLGAGSSSATSPGCSLSGLETSLEEVVLSPSYTSLDCDNNPHYTPSPGSTLRSLTSTRSRRSERSSKSTKTIVKKIVTRSTLSLNVGDFSNKTSLLTDLKKSNSCDDRNVILHPGISRTRERKDKTKVNLRQKGDEH